MLIDLLRHAPRDRVEWFVVFFESGPLVEKVQAMGIEAQVLSTGRLRHAHRFLTAIWHLVSMIQKERIDIVLSWSAKPHLYGGPAAFFTNTPAVWYQLGYPVGRHRSWIDHVATLIPARVIITLSESARQGQESIWPSRPTHLVYPSVRLEQFDPEQLPPPEEARRKLGLPNDGPLIGMVGRLQEWKGMHTLVAAMPNILEQHPHAHAVIVGGSHDLEPNYPARLRQEVEARNLKNNVSLVGFQSDIPLWMQAMDVVVHASDNEPFGIVIVEAMALGKPVVAGDQGGPAEIISDGENGLLASFENSDALAQQILSYLNQPGFSSMVQSSAQDRASDFSPEKYAKQVVEIVEDLKLT